VGFRGDRSRRASVAIRSGLDAARNGTGSGPSELECLLFTGHVTVSTDLGLTNYGFHPRPTGMPLWRVLDHLRGGGALPGIVQNDTPVLAAAQARGLLLLRLDIVLPDPQFQSFRAALDGERQASQYSYGFPNGDGDCNCVTWAERLGLPLLTGRMPEFAGLAGWVSDPVRRFGQCA
jgi:hypothetical protein